MSSRPKTRNEIIVFELIFYTLTNEVSQNTVDLCRQQLHRSEQRSPTLKPSNLSGSNRQVNSQPKTRNEFV